MSYRELVFTVVAETAEPLGDALLELGALSVTVEDAAAGGYDENPLYGEPGLSPDVQAWERSSVTALFNPEIDNSGSSEFITDLLISLKESGFHLASPQEKIIEDQTQLLDDISEKRLLKEEVDAEDIAANVAKATGIPVMKMLQSEREKLLLLEDELHKRVVGQNEAIEAVSDAIRRSRAGLQERSP